MLPHLEMSFIVDLADLLPSPESCLSINYRPQYILFCPGTRVCVGLGPGEEGNVDLLTRVPPLIVQSTAPPVQPCLCLSALKMKTS